MARALEVNGKARQGEGEAKVVKWKAPSGERTKMRGIYFIDPEDKEFKETIKNARKKLETSVAPAMPCKIMKKNCASGGSIKIKNKTCVYSGSWWIYKTAYGKIITKSSWRPHCRKRHKFIPMPQALKIPAAKAAVDKEWEKWRKFRRGTWHKSEVNQRWSMKQGRPAQKFILHH